MKFIYPQNFLIRNPNTIPNAIASNNSEQKGTNGNNSNKDDKNKKER